MIAFVVQSISVARRGPFEVVGSKMKLQFAQIPRPVRVAAGMLVLMIFGNIPFVYYSINVFLGLAVFAGAYLGIAYGLLRGSDIVRLLWSLWTVVDFLLLFARALTGFVTFQNPFSWRDILSLYMVATVVLLYGKSSHGYFRRNAASKQRQSVAPVEEPGNPRMSGVCPVCLTPYGVVDRLSKPTMCSSCFKLGRTVPVAHITLVEPHGPMTARFLAWASTICYVGALVWVALGYFVLGKFGIAAVFVVGPVLAITYIPAGVLALVGLVLTAKSLSRVQYVPSQPTERIPLPFPPFKPDPPPRPLLCKRSAMKTALLRTAALAFASYFTAYLALFSARTPAAKNPGGQLAYWCYIDGTQTKQERLAYTVFWPLYRIHKGTLGLGSVHVFDLEGYHSNETGRRIY